MLWNPQALQDQPKLPNAIEESETARKTATQETAVGKAKDKADKQAKTKARTSE